VTHIQCNTRVNSVVLIWIIQMNNDDERLVAPPCVACGGPAYASVKSPGGELVNLCWKHTQEHEALRVRTLEVYRAHMDRLEDHMDDIAGLPRKTRVPAPRVNVHQVNIHGNNLGVVNTGTVNSIANNVTIINGTDSALAMQLKQLTEAIIASTTLNRDQKQEAADLLNEVVEDVAKPPQQRRSRAVMKTITVALGQMLSHAADLYTLWTAVEPHLK
jgi:hypothetical protein